MVCVGKGKDASEGREPRSWVCNDTLGHAGLPSTHLSHPIVPWAVRAEAGPKRWEADSASPLGSS